MKQIVAAAILAGALVSLTACASSQQAGNVLTQAVAASRLDREAIERCTQASDGGQFVAAMDSTPGEVRDIAADVGTPSEALDDLPASNEDYVAICITTIPTESRIEGTYLARYLYKEEYSMTFSLLDVW